MKLGPPCGSGCGRTGPVGDKDHARRVGKPWMCRPCYLAAARATRKPARPPREPTDPHAWRGSWSRRDRAPGYAVTTEALAKAKAILERPLDELPEALRVETLARVIAILSERRMGRVLRMKAKGALEQFAARLEAERTQREINAMVAEGMGYGDVTKNTR